MNEKQNQQSQLGVAKVVAVIFLVTIGALLSYKVVEKDVKSNVLWNLSNGSMLSTFFVEPTYVLDYILQTEGMNPAPKPADILLENKLGDKQPPPKSSNVNVTPADDSAKEAYEGPTFEEQFDSWKRFLMSQKEGPQYYALDLETGRYKTDMKHIPMDEYQGVQVYEQVKNGSFYTVMMRFDEEGNVAIKDSGDSERIIGDNLESTQLSSYDWEYEQNRTLKPITNKLFIYNLPKAYVTRRAGGWGLTHAYDSALMWNIPGWVTIFSGIVMVVGLLIPYRWIRDWKVFKKIYRTPIELWLPLCIYIPCLWSWNLNGFFMDWWSGEVTWLLELGITEPSLHTGIIYLTQGLIWFVVAGTVIVAMLIVKTAFIEGAVDYLKSTSLIFKLSKWIDKRLDGWAERISHMNPQGDQTKGIKRVVLVNALIMTVCSAAWFFGIIGIIIYTVVLFILLKKVMMNIGEKYGRMREMIESVSGGQLDVQVEENLGLFEPIKDSLSEIQVDLKEHIEEAVKSHRLKTELITNVSHDLKTPLTSIISYVDLLKDESLSLETRKQYLEVLDRKSERLKSLIENLFEVSKATSGALELHKESVNVVALLKQTLFELEDRLQVAKLKVRTHFPEHKVMVQLDSQRSYRVFENLVGNMSKYAMPGTRVHVEVEEDEKEVTISLKNISREELSFNPEEITERFVRGDQSRKTEGSGLGLAIAKTFVEVQGGRFAIEIDGDLFKAIIHFPK